MAFQQRLQRIFFNTWLRWSASVGSKKPSENEPLPMIKTETMTRGLVRRCSTDPFLGCGLSKMTRIIIIIIRVKNTTVKFTFLCHSQLVSYQLQSFPTKTCTHSISQLQNKSKLYMCHCCKFCLVFPNVSSMWPVPPSMC